MKFQLVIASVFACLLQTGALAQQVDVGTLVERTVERVRQQFPADADDRLGSYRTALLRIGTATQIQSLIPRSPETKIQAVSTQLIKDWYSANPDAYREILEFAGMQGIATSEIAGVVRNSGLHAIKLGRYEEGERFLSLIPAFPSNDFDSFDLVMAYASGGDFTSADKRLMPILEIVSVSSAQWMVHQFASIGYLQGAVRILEKIKDRPGVLQVVAAALNGASTAKRKVDISQFVHFVSVMQLARLSVDDVTDDKGDSWSRALKPCEPARKALYPQRRPYPLAHVPVQGPIIDCFTTPPGAIPSLALILHRVGENDLAEAILDRAATLLLSAATPESIEVYQSANVPRRPLTKDDYELYHKTKHYVTSLLNIAGVAAAIESALVGKKVIPILRSADQLYPSHILAVVTEPTLFEEELARWPHKEFLGIELVRLEAGLRNNDAAMAISALEKLIANGNFRSGALAHLNFHYVQNPTLSVLQVRDHFLNHVRTARSNGQLKAQRFAYSVMTSYLDYVIALGDPDLARELTQDRFELLAAASETKLAQHDAQIRVYQLTSTLMDCFTLSAQCPLDRIGFRIDDKASSDYFNAALIDTLARAGQTENALLHVRRMSQPFPDVKTYPGYLREAWGHLAHAYARQGDIEKALAIIGDGKAGKPGGTIDAVIDGWITAGHYKR